MGWWFSLRTHLQGGCLYTAYMLYLLLSFLLIQSFGRVFALNMAGAPAELAARISNLAVTAGMLLYPCLRHFFRSGRARERWLCFFGVASLVLLIPLGSAGMYLPAAIATSLACGYLGGAVYLRLAQVTSFHLRGRLLGFGIAAVYGLQYLVQTLGALSGEAELCLGAGAGLCLTASLYLLLRGLRAPVKQEAAAGSGQPLPPHYLLLLIVAVFLASLLHGLNEGGYVMLYAGMQLDPYAAVRLFSLPGCLLAGWLADKAARRYLPMALLMSMTARIICLQFFHEDSGYFFSLALAYFCSGFMVVFITIYFLDVALRTRCPALWAGMGRAVELPAAALGAYIGGALWGAVPLWQFISFYTILLLALLVICYYHELSVRPLQPVMTMAAASSPDVCLYTGDREPALLEPSPLPAGEYARLYQLTPRETEVLEQIMRGKQAKEMAADLSITERTVKYHISHILAKSGCKTQLELMTKIAQTRD